MLQFDAIHINCVLILFYEFAPGHLMASVVTLVQVVKAAARQRNTTKIEKKDEKLSFFLY